MVTKVRDGEEKIERGNNSNLESSDEVLINCNKTNSDLERGGPKTTLIDQFYAQEDAFYNLLKKNKDWEILAMIIVTQSMMITMTMLSIMEREARGNVIMKIRQ